MTKRYRIASSDQAREVGLHNGKNLDKHDEHHGDKGNYGNNPLSLVEPLADELQYIHRCLSLFCFAVTGDALPHLPRPVTQKVRFQFSQRGFR